MHGQVERLETTGMPISNVPRVATQAVTPIRAITPATLNIQIIMALANIAIPMPLITLQQHRGIDIVPRRIARYPAIQLKIIKRIINAKQLGTTALRLFYALNVEAWPCADNDARTSRKSRRLKYGNAVCRVQLITSTPSAARSVDNCS